MNQGVSVPSCYTFSLAPVGKYLGGVKALIETANLLLLSLALLAGSSCWAAPGDGKRASHDDITLWHERCQKLGSGRTCVMQGCHSRLPFPAHVLL